MNIIGQYLDAREDARARTQSTDDWMVSSQLAAQRLLSFDRWCRNELETRLQWPSNPAAQARQIEQCRVKLEKIALELWRRNWLLDGKRLAQHLRSAIDAVAAMQAKGAVKDLYAYFSASIDRYVGLHAEELQAEARLKSVGQLAHQLLAQAGVKAETIPELIAQRRDEINKAKEQKSLRQQLTAQRRTASEAGQSTFL
jgi:hypothetical protein